MERTYVRVFFSVLVFGAVSVAVWNWLVDPFSLFNSPTIGGLNEDKGEYLKYLRLTKAYAVLRRRPDAVILGTSRSGRGISTAHEAWRGLVAYNLAVPAGSMYENRRLLQHAHAANKLQRALLGVDLRLFNASRVNPAFVEGRMLTTPNGDANAELVPTVISDLFGTLLSTDALQSSLRTVRFQGWNAEALFEDGRWDRTRADYHHRAAFIAYTNASIRRLGNLAGPLAGLEEYRQLVRFAHHENIDLRMFISPSHSTHWVLLKKLGLWPRFEYLKRELVRINLEEADRSRDAPFPLWDFSGINAVSREPLPREGRSGERMKWFWESIHYKSILGDVVVEKVFENETRAGGVGDFGVNLNEVDLDEYLSAESRRLQEFIAENPPEVRLVTQLLAASRR